VSVDGRQVACAAVRCPACGSLDDKVIDSRQSGDGAAIRRRRECLACARRYTTFERLEEALALVVVVKRAATREPFDRDKVIAGVLAAAKGRPVDDDDASELAARVEDEMRLEGGEVTSERVGRAVLDQLRGLDQVAAVRFASVYKEFDDVADFEREITLLAKRTVPKHR
jgi:transcriptional repressor NrdR